jgi:hypothetical protein
MQSDITRTLRFLTVAVSKISFSYTWQHCHGDPIALIDISLRLSLTLERHGDCQSSSRGLHLQENSAVPVRSLSGNARTADRIIQDADTVAVVLPSSPCAMYSHSRLDDLCSLIETYSGVSGYGTSTISSKEILLDHRRRWQHAIVALAKRLRP